MESQHACINHNAAVLSPSPSRKITIKFKNLMRTTITNAERYDPIQKSSVSKVEKTHGKRVFDNGMCLGFNKDTVVHANDFEPESAQVLKKIKRKSGVWDRVDVVAAKRFKQVQKTRQHMEDTLLQSFVNAKGEPACPICQKTFESIKFLYEHMALKSDKEWKTFFASLDAHNISKSGGNRIHDTMVDLTKCLPRWDMKTGKRGRLGSKVADVMVNKGPNTKEYYGLIAVDQDMNELAIEAAKTLILISRDKLPNATKRSMMTQREVEMDMVESRVQAKEFRATNMIERQIQVKDLADTTNGEFKVVLGIDLNKPLALEDDEASVTMTW